MELAAIRKALHVERNVDKADGPPCFVSVRTGEPGCGYAHIGFHCFSRALCHLMRRLAGYGGADVKRFLLDTKKPVLALVEAEEAKLDVDALVADALANTEKVAIRYYED